MAGGGVCGVVGGCGLGKDGVGVDGVIGGVGFRVWERIGGCTKVLDGSVEGEG